MRNMSEAETKVRIAKRVAEMLPDGGFVNLGVGIPTMAVDYLPANKHIYIQTENGMLGVGPKQLSGEAIIPNLINASRTPVTETPGCCYFDSATSFAMIRSGRMDATVIGAIQINEAERELKRYFDGLDAGEDEIEKIEERLSIIYAFKKKYICTSDSLADKLESLRNEYDMLMHSRERLELLENERKELFKNMGADWEYARIGKYACCMIKI